MNEIFIIKLDFTILWYNENLKKWNHFKSTFKKIITTVISSIDWECLFHYASAAETKAFAAASGASLS